MNSFCEVCGMGDMMLGGDSTLYCGNCGAQATNYVEEEFEADDAIAYNAAFVRVRGVERNVAHQNAGLLPGNVKQEALGDHEDHQGPIRLTAGVHHAGLSMNEDAPQPGSQFGSQLGSQFGQGSYPTGQIPNDELASTIRKSYVSGVQKILQLQCECLVKEFRVTPMICGIVGPIWLKYVASSRVFEEVWAEEAVEVAEHRERVRKGNQRHVFQAAAADDDGDGAAIKQSRGKRGRKPRKRKGGSEPRTSYGRKVSYVWLSALKERIPLSFTLALCYLSCYIAREPVLPTDITEWASKGQLPYLAVFLEITKPAPHHIPNTVGGRRSFPMKPRLMFCPVNMVSARRLELQAGFIAQRVAVQLPPVNFHSIGAMLLNYMGLPVEQLSAYASRLYEWYTPSGLWLSAQEEALPTRVYVMAMLIISIKILYKLDGRSLPNEGKTKTLKFSKGLLSTNGLGNGSHRQALHRMETSASLKQKEGVEASKDMQQGTCPGNKINGTNTGVGEASEDNLCTPKTHILGKRKRFSRVISGKDEGSMSSGDKRQVLSQARSSKFSNTNATFQEDWTELRNPEELLEKLESVKMTNTVNDDERLSSYLKYCQDVIFTNYDRDAGIEPILERCRGIYEKHMTEVTRKQVFHSDEEGAAGAYQSSKFAAGSSAAAGCILESNAEQKHSDSGRDIYRKRKLKRGIEGSLEGAESVLSDVPSAGSLRTSRDIRLEPSAPQKQQKSMDKLLPSLSNVGQGSKKFEAGTATAVDKGSIRKQASSNFLNEMKNAGFSLLPPLTNHVSPDEYVRYSFEARHGPLIPVHRDYFKVLQACGKLIKVHAKALHRCVQMLEKGLLRVEKNVEKFLLGKNGDVSELSRAVKRRRPLRRRDKIAEVENTKSAAEIQEHLMDLGYI